MREFRAAVVALSPWLAEGADVPVVAVVVVQQALAVEYAGRDRSFEDGAQKFAWIGKPRREEQRFELESIERFLWLRGRAAPTESRCPDADGSACARREAPAFRATLRG